MSHFSSYIADVMAVLKMRSQPCCCKVGVISFCLGLLVFSPRQRTKTEMRQRGGIAKKGKSVSLQRAYQRASQQVCRVERGMLCVARGPVQTLDVAAMSMPQSVNKTEKGSSRSTTCVLQCHKSRLILTIKLNHQVVCKDINKLFRVLLPLRVFRSRIHVGSAAQVITVSEGLEIRSKFQQHVKKWGIPTKGP